MGTIFNKENFENKSLLILGDSTSAQATIGEGNKTYSTLLKEYFNMKYLLNAAIGGTTLTYMFEGSNIDKEYHDHQVAIDGCRVCKRLEDENKLKDFDIVIIAYGHNDQYFQPAIDEEDKTLNSLNDIHSFKKSYDYIITTLKKNNPNVKIIIMNCTYSEYDITYKTPYDVGLHYIDYRNASAQIAEKYQLDIVDPWDYMKQFSDYTNGNVYYKDSVHMTPLGHLKLFEFLITK